MTRAPSTRASLFSDAKPLNGGSSCSSRRSPGQSGSCLGVSLCSHLAMATKLTWVAASDRDRARRRMQFCVRGADSPAASSPQLFWSLHSPKGGQQSIRDRFSLGESRIHNSRLLLFCRTWPGPWSRVQPNPSLCCECQSVLEQLQSGPTCPKQ